MEGRSTSSRCTFVSQSNAHHHSTRLTVGVDVVGQEEVELPDGDVDVVRVDTEAGVQTVGRLLQPLPVCALQGNSFEENHLDQV